MESVTEESSPAGSTDATEGRRFGPWRRECRSFLELVALCGVAIAQPTLDIFQQNADFLLSRRTTVQEAVVFAVVLIVAPATLLWTLEVLVGLLLPRARRWVHAGIGGVLVAIIAIELLKQATGLGAGALVLAGVVLGALGGLAIFRFAIIRTWLRYLSIAPPVLAALFVFSSQVTPVIFVDDPSAADVTIAQPKRVVMIVMDEFPTSSLLDGKGQLDSALYPNLAAFARSANWYRNQTTVSPHTTTAVPAILTGDFPHGNAVPIASKFPENLFTLLGGEYRMNVHESATRLCPVDLCGEGDTSAVNDGIGGLLGEGVSQWRKFASPNRTSRQDALLHQSPHVENAIDSSSVFIESLTPSKRPQLDFLHLLLPHTPWHYLGPGQDYRNGGGQGRRVGVWRDPWSAQFGRERHLLQVQTADWIIGQVIKKLERIGAYDDSMIIVTADHGVAFLPGAPSRGASQLSYHEIMWTPLLVKLPGQTTGVVDDRPAYSTDILPTIADELKIENPWPMDGRSLLGAARADRPRRLADWPLNWVRPTDDKDYVEFDSAAGFANLLKTSASPATGDPALRIYRNGAYGHLVGERAAPLVSPGGRDRTATLEDPGKYARVKLHASEIAWAYATGTVDLPARRWVAIVANGRVAGVSQTLPGDSTGRSEYAAILPPSLMRDGRNDIEIFVVSGPATDLRLEPTRLER